MVFYRKYRSQTINDLDSQAVRQTLLSILQKPESIPHAFLFTGPKGLGKTSTARIVAKVVNCERRNPKSSNIEPCNICEQCVSITNGTNLDVFEFDAASNRGIDEIRDLKEKIRLSPVAAKKKVYIIDEVHMLTTEAFNALLKTLEEPPEHAMFMLCTTEAYKVPETIVSRCFQIAFKKATSEEIVRSLQRIVAGEKLNVDDTVLMAIADNVKTADGGFRDAAKLFEEIVLSSQGVKITKESFEKLHKLATSASHSASLLGALKNCDTKLALQVVGELQSEGVDIKYFIAQILADLHSKLLKKIGVEPSSENEFPVHLRFEVEELKLLMQLFSQASSEMRYAVLPQLPLELAIIEYISLANAKLAPETSIEQPVENITVNVTSQITAVQQVSTSGGATSVNDLRKQVGAMKKLQALYGETKTADTKPVSSITGEHPVDLMHTFPDGEVTKEWLHAFWTSIIIEMKQYNHTIAGVLRGCMIKSYDKKNLVIETAYKFHKERLDDLKTKGALLKVCKTLTGNEVTVTIELRK